jgi:hypothetical protein
MAGSSGWTPIWTGSPPAWPGWASHADPHYATPVRYNELL